MKQQPRLNAKKDYQYNHNTNQPSQTIHNPQVKIQKTIPQNMKKKLDKLNQSQGHLWINSHFSIFKSLDECSISTIYDICQRQFKQNNLNNIQQNTVKKFKKQQKNDNQPNTTQNQLKEIQVQDKNRLRQNKEHIAAKQSKKANFVKLIPF